MKQTTVDNTKPLMVHFEARTKLSTSSREHKEQTKSVTYFLAKDMVPLYTIEKSRFKKMIARFNLQYDLPSRNYYSRVAIPT